MTFLVGKHPFVTLKVKLPKGKWVKLKCLIDTGFSGGMVLPQSIKSYFPADKFVEAHFLLADGSGITVDASFTEVEYKGRKKEVAVVFMGNSDNLVGVEFLDQMKFCLDLKENKVELS